MPAPTKLHQLGDRRHLAQQADVVEAPLLDRQGGPLGLRHPTDLVFDVAHEGFDPLRRGLGLLLLDLDRGAPVVLVDEVEVEGGIDDQNAGHQADEQHDVLEEEPAPHSITSSARDRIDGGMARPRALAVLRLMTNSNVVGCRAGRSAGLAPLRIFPA